MERSYRGTFWSRCEILIIFVSEMFSILIRDMVREASGIKSGAPSKLRTGEPTYPFYDNFP